MSENFEVEIKSYFNSILRNNSYVDILISSPSPVQRRTLGRLIIISKLDSKIQTKNLVNIINENIRSNYYANLNANIEFAIESTLIDFNNKIEDIEKIEKIKNFASSFSSIIIIVKDNDIYFTQYGATDVLLINKGKIINIGEENKNNNGDRIFSDIVIGKIYKNNILLFGTKSLFNYVSIDKIANHLQNSNIENTIEFIEKSLDAKGEISDGVGIVIIGQNKTIKAEEQYTQPSIEEKPNVILEKIETQIEKTTLQIVDKEEITNNISPALNKGTDAFNRFKNKINNHITNLSNNENLNEVGIKIKHSLKIGFTKLGNFIKVNSKIGAKKLTNLIKNLPNTTIKKAKIVKEDIKQEPIDIKINKKINKSKNWFKDLEPSKRVLLISLIILVIVLIFILRIYQINKATKAEANEYQASIEAIKSLQNEASSAIIYNNVSKAQDLISEADYLINQLKTDSKTRKDTQNQLLVENKNILNKVFKITDITNPTLLNDFSSIQDQGQVNINKILKLNDKLFAFDYQNKSIYSFSKDGIEKLNIQSDIGTILACNNVTTENNNILIVDSNKKLYVFDGTKIINIDMGDKLKNYNIDDISSYDSNIYLVDKTNGKVLSIRKTNNKYGTPVSWLKDQFDFNTYSSISIDGYIYLANSGGIIKKYLKGYEKTFNLDTINPKLDHIDKIYTDENIDKIYILDKSQNRLLIFNKNNVSLVAQYKSTEFDNLQDFIIDTKNNKAYLLNGTKVFEVIF
ncbi:MAG TPA: hypothetical protein PLM63_00110 [bacterium]|nr:hypothetical protein [bacterium]HQL11574.1 hypothetical protein [bacterium]